MEQCRGPVQVQQKKIDNQMMDHIVLGYDLWREMPHLQGLINTTLQLNKVDYHIGTKVYNYGENDMGTSDKLD